MLRKHVELASDISKIDEIVRKRVKEMADKTENLGGL
jgi:hypothetical protein